MRILVTGGTGFLGKRILARLAEAGHDLYALTRSSTSHTALAALGATPVQGNLEGREPLSLPPIDAVVHAAALFRFAGPRAAYFRTNVDGTAALIKAARAPQARWSMSARLASSWTIVARRCTAPTKALPPIPQAFQPI
jgi:nucleoside-diphosphate-sugar epimerase